MEIDDEAEVSEIERQLEKAERVKRAEERVKRRQRNAEAKDNVVACRLDGTTLAAIDSLVEAGVRPNRADAAAWLISVGLDAHKDLLDDIAETVAQIKQLREDAASKAREFTTGRKNPSQPQ
ncbi:MAG TPA: hypothetical protein VHC49_21385 [Mycobacteriales bacterium]|nr:hypothetical protein [Mycobacteriales bacterium]